MAVVFNGEVAEVHLRSTLFGQQVESVVYALKASGWPVEDLASLAEACAEWYTVDVMTELSENLIFRECTAISLLAADAPGVVNTDYANNTGSVLSPSLPGNCAAVISFRTAFRGRSARGRNYVPGIPENQVVGNTMDNTWANDLLAFYDNLGTVMNGVGATHAVYSQFANGVPRASGVPYPVNAYVLTDLFLDSQRKRLTGRGV